ncbi:MAG: hypothetical protein RLZZ401_32 [Pseudomonadota bacterium]
MKLSHSRAVGLMVLVTLMWSIAGVVTRHLGHARSFEITFWRSLFTALSLLVILPLWRGKAVFGQIPWRSRLFWWSSACWCVMFTAFMLALTLTTVANVLVTLALGPLLTALFSRLFLGDRLAWRTWLAIALGGCGIAVMQAAQLALGQGAWTGFLVAACAPVAAAVQWTMMQHTHAQARTWDQPTPDLVPCVMLGATLSCLVTLPLALPFQSTGHDLTLLALLGLVQLAVPCVLSVLCAAVLKSPEMALLALLEVLFGIALAWVGAGETPGPHVLLGGALVMTALVGNELFAWRQRAGRTHG